MMPPSMDHVGDTDTGLAGAVRFQARSLLALVFLVTGGLLLAQERSETHPPGPNPHLGNEASVRGGMVLYRVRCGDCHGLDASGYRGPDLIAALAGGTTDERLFQTMRKGVPGTEMGPSRAPDDDLLMIIAYLRNLGTTAPPERPIGNVEHGQRLFASQCASCHRVAGDGGRLGPDLTRIGAARSRAALVREIRTPSEWIAPGYETVTLVTADGERIGGIKKNEDVFSIQIMDLRERLQGYHKSGLKDLIYEKMSLMPAYGSRQLNDSDLDDLVGYLSTLRGEDSSIR
jgi:putative heme-binding domain-containing protein